MTLQRGARNVNLISWYGSRAMLRTRIAEVSRVHEWLWMDKRRGNRHGSARAWAGRRRSALKTTWWASWFSYRAGVLWRAGGARRRRALKRGRWVNNC